MGVENETDQDHEPSPPQAVCSHTVLCLPILCFSQEAIVTASRGSSAKKLKVTIKKGGKEGGPHSSEVDTAKK